MVWGCYTQSQVYSDKVRDVDLSAYNTYAWLPTSGDSASLMSNELLHTNLMNEIDDQMQMRGYAPDGENPDMLVLLHVDFEQETDVARDPVYGSYEYVYPVYTVNGYPYYYRSYNQVTYVDGYAIDSVEYTTGSVVVDVIDAETSKLVWRGWSERVIDPASYSKNMHNDVKAIFSEYPVPAQTSGDYSSR